MAKNSQPIVKRCRALGISPATMGYTGKTKNNLEGRKPGPQRRAKKSEYALQLNEKQKVKFIYGVLEKQFRTYYEKAARQKGNTGDELMVLLERRLDNVVYRLGFAKTRREARQLVNHGHFTVNGKRVNIPSYLVKVGDVVAVGARSRNTNRFKAIAEDNLKITSAWLEKNKETPFQGRVTAMPVVTEAELGFEVSVNLIVELYSK